jgi:acyl-CoA synthetase (AMP-forming)/AMP-acid ligase II
MPLFHIHGLVGALLASLAAGGSVVCAAGSSVFSFEAHLASERATWTTAVPSLYGAALARAGRRAQAPARGRLRFLRSCSSALAPSLLRELEARFEVPVIEAYGMTEAAHQIASNPLPPGERRPGTVGRPAGPRVAVLDAAGEELAPGARGELAVRGPSVMHGYEANPEANAEAFAGPWLRTGDEGELAANGVLRLTGRLKEQINRGGEKVSPREVDDALCEHPAVAQALAFALPDARLGEEVAAAVVLRAGAQVDERSLRRFAADKLAGFKVPRRIVFLTELPKSATGKPQRIGLARRLGLTEAPPDGDGAGGP